MLFQQLLRLENHFIDKFGSLLCLRDISLYQQRFPLLIWMIMGWGASDVLVATLDNQQMAVLYACDEFHTLATFALVYWLRQSLVQIIYQHSSILCLKISAVVSDNLSVLQVDDVTAQSQIIVSHLVADRCSLKWSAALVYLIQVVTQDSCVGHLASRRKSLGHSNQASATSLLSQPVHHRLRCIL